jgi:signal transduction histidine kinase
MVNNAQQQPMIKSLPPFPIDGKIVLKELNLSKIVKSVETVLRPYVDEKIRIKTEIACGHLPVAADKTRMGEAILNLVHNAAEAMPDGGILTLRTGLVTSQDRPPYQTGFCAPGACAIISVGDTGIGMNTVIKKSMFEPYFTTKKGIHKGLGLPVAYSIIREHNGCIKVESAPGKGTTLKVYLPLIRRSIEEEDAMLLPRSYFGEAHGEYKRC